jgi:type IV pilus assembly protein PilY1
MKNIAIKLLKPALCAAVVFCAAQAQAFNVLSISAEPLGTGTGLSVKPNLWFVLDDSGSMDSTFTPDYVNNSICQSNISNPAANSTYSCNAGDPPYMAAGFNKSYYNPAITYTPPVNANGSSFGNASPTAAKGEPFRYPSASTAVTTTCYGSGYTDIGSSGNRVCNLTQYFPRKTWCRSDGTQCRESTDAEKAAGNAYAYPGVGGDGQTRTTSGSTQYGAPYYYVMSGSPIWCSDRTLTNCPSNKWSSTTPYPKFNGGSAVPGTAATVSVTITEAGHSSCSGTACRVTKVVVDSGGSLQKVLFNGNIYVTGANSPANRNTLAANIVAAINGQQGFSAEQTVTCGSSSPSGCNPVFVVTAPPGQAAAATATSGNTTYNNKKLSISDNSSRIDISISNGANFSGGQNQVASFAGVNFTRYDIIPAVTSYPKASTRTDCAGTTCSYTEELQNFANWFSYYRGRLLMSKSAISLAFKDVSDSQPGIGFRVGFSVISMGTSSPQSGFSELSIADFNTAQRNSFYSKLFAIYPNSWTPLRTALSRAGQMFAGNVGTDPMQYSCQQNYTFLASDGYWNTNIEPNTNFNMNQSGTVGDVDASAVVPYKDKQAKADTLADIARYYYTNDLRPGAVNDVPKASGDETTSSKMWQHMKTFTMGLGVDGNLSFCPSYQSGCSTDYNTILADGLKDWGNPINNTTADRIDDLWHAAVNGHGQYFSAADPNEVGDAIAKTLAAAEQQTGSAAAAATSNLEPVAGDNFAYVASYTTNVWDGNLEAKTIDLSTGELSTNPVWTASDQLDVQGTSGGRILYTFKTGAPKFKLMTWANLTPAEQAYFNPTQMTACNPIANCPGATSENLFDFITGKLDVTTNSSYRDRNHVLGDIVSSQPVFVKTPGFNYSDSGYDSYKAISRQGMVYVGANDGFLHAFNADSGAEVWAYAPSSVLPNLWKLADPAYTHTYYVDGTLTAGDINSGGWRTILVGGMNAGGKLYYAWDVTNPSAPNLLWEFTDPDMGLTYGNPVITKLTDGSWVVLLTSGYNNPSGVGYLYVLDAVSGSVRMKISTGSGTPTQPSGLAKIANWVDDPLVNNTTQYVYGGDLNGDMWRFDLNTGSSARLAAVGEPITTRPELAEVKYNRVAFFGTGLFLQGSDRIDLGSRAIYAVKDDGSTTFGSVRGNSAFVEQNFIPGGDTRTLTSNSINWDTQFGWYIPLPDSGERVNVDPKIQLGTLVVPSNVPTSTGANTCTVGGYAWLNYIDYTTGSDVKNSKGEVIKPSQKLTGALAVGVNIVRLPDGKVVAITTTADNRHPVTEVPVGSSAVKARRISWRELTNN